MTNNSSTSIPSHHHNVIPSEVGWQFVPQYYTFVNKQPNRLHCFYTKASTFIHGTEGEDGKPCFGQQEIHNKITSIGFEDCKVFIHSVDAQSSANGGIIIQVIGEMSNHGDPWRKFVQTFFLAEQPNGYFVLNDIFRFLKEETVEGDDISENAAETETPASATASAVPAADHQAAASEPAPPSVADSVPAMPTQAPVEEPPTTVIPEPLTPITPVREPTPQKVNGIHAPAPEHESAPASATSTTASSSLVEDSPTPEPAIATPPPAAAPPIAPTSSQSAAVPPQQSQPAPQPTATPAAAPAPVPQPAAPPAPKTWANLAAANSKKWGSAVAQESRGTTEVANHPTPPPVVAPSTSGGPHPNAPHAPPHAQGQPNSARPIHSAVISAQSVVTAQCFIKGVNELISLSQLTATLTQRFGPLKESPPPEIVRTKACAFIEFQNLESARRAIIASLPVGHGGEGGLWVEVGGDVGSVRIVVETKKERGDRPPGRGRSVNGGPRGGNGGDRGNFRGTTGGGPARGRGVGPK